MTLPRNAWRRWRVRIGYPVGVIYWLLAAPTVRAIVIGSAVAAVGLIIRGIASGYLQKDEELTTTGIYAHTRNPLYLGSAFLAAGFLVAGRSWIAAIIVGVYFVIFYYAAIRNEEAYLREEFGAAAFDAYAARVPIFFPWFVKAEQREGAATASSFSWTQYKRNREYQALLGTIAGIGLLLVRMWLRARFGR
jgi:protein-S-isoprenylcysteine O-methyltransferase Ste14